MRPGPLAIRASSVSVIVSLLVDDPSADADGSLDAVWPNGADMSGLVRSQMLAARFMMLYNMASN